jgi:hypothetical protein
MNETLEPLESEMKKLALGAIALTLCLTACSTAPTATTPATAPAASPKVEAVSMAKYEQVKTGMALAEVEKILGKGIETSRMDAMGTTTVSYNWKNSNGSSMSAVFQNDLVTSKMQFGLK